ncbi:MAG: DUF349 domain-containing protein, partial [Aeromicrobium sp.]
ALDNEFEENAGGKEAILVEVEKLLPTKDREAVRHVWHGIADRWEAAGKVPRGRVKDMEGRLRKVEQAVRAANDQEWQRSDPEKSARADDMVSKLESAIEDLRADLAEAQSSGDKKKVAELEENLASRESFLAMAQKASSDYSA